ncbi:MAG: hypothetical protein ABII00_18680 [Elusimicrobiota bacterium]
MATTLLFGVGNLLAATTAQEPPPPPPDQALAALIEALPEAEAETPLAVVITTVTAKLQDAIASLTADPAEPKAAMASVDEAAGDLEAAMAEGSLAAEQGASLLTQLAAIAKSMATASQERAHAGEHNHDACDAWTMFAAQADMLLEEGMPRTAISQYRKAGDHAEDSIK